MLMSDVLIIGAGCSVPYGFPTGAMLMQKLKDYISAIGKKPSYHVMKPADIAMN